MIDNSDNPIRCPVCGGYAYPEHTPLTDTKIVRCSLCGEVFDEEYLCDYDTDFNDKIKTS